MKAKPKKLSKGRLRYAEWLYSDSILSFIDWLKWKQRQAKERTDG